MYNLQLEIFRQARVNKQWLKEFVKNTVTPFSNIVLLWLVRYAKGLQCTILTDKSFVLLITELTSIIRVVDSDLNTSFR